MIDIKSIQTYEESLLGCMLLDNSCINDIAISLNENDFFIENHKLIFNLIKKVYQKENRCDSLELYYEVQRIQKEKELPLAYISNLTTYRNTASNYEFYLKAIKEQSKTRQVQAKLKEFSESVDVENVESVVESVQTFISDFSVLETKRNIFRNSDISLFVDSLKKNTNVINTKFMDFELGEYVVIGARTSIGKTAFSLNVFYDLICKNIPTAFLSLEMTQKQILRRLYAISSNSQNLLNAFKTCNFTNEHLSEINRISSFLYEKNFVITENINDIQQIELTINKLIKENQTKIFFIDYVGLIKDKQNQQKAKWEIISEVSSTLQRIAKSKQIVIVALCQLVRESENKKGIDKELKIVVPTVADLRDSGSIEQDSDKIYLLYGDRNSNERYLELAKNRNGELFNKKKLSFFGNTQKFVFN